MNFAQIGVVPLIRERHLADSRQGLNLLHLVSERSAHWHPVPISVNRCQLRKAEAERATQLLKMLLLHYVVSASVQMRKGHRVQRAEVRETILGHLKLLHSTFNGFVRSLLGEGHECDPLRLHAGSHRFLDQSEQPRGLAGAWRSKDFMHSAHASSLLMMGTDWLGFHLKDTVQFQSTLD